MRFPGPYSHHLMTGVLLGLGPPTTHCTSHEDPAPNWDKDVCNESLSFAQSSSILLGMVNALDRQPVGWFPPLYPSPRSHSNQNFPPTPITITPDLLKSDTFDCGYPDIHGDSVYPTSSESSSSTPISPGFTRSPSPFVPAQGSEDEIDSLEPSPLQIIRKKVRKNVRQNSGVKPKAKTSRARGLRDVGAASRSNSPLEMVQCQWAGCTKELHVDYIDVSHWGKHVRGHYANGEASIQCEWNGGCGVSITKSSVWKHIVVHQPKFKIRCPRGCDVSTRSDMMRRHLQSCPYIPGQADKEGEADEEENMEAEEGSHGGDDGDGEDSEEEGREY